MKKSDIYDAFSRLAEDQLDDSEQFEAIAADLKRARSRRIRVISSLCSFVFAIIIGGAALLHGIPDRPDIPENSGESGYGGISAETTAKPAETVLPNISESAPTTETASAAAVDDNNEKVKQTEALTEKKTENSTENTAENDPTPDDEPTDEGGNAPDEKPQKPTAPPKTEPPAPSAPSQQPTAGNANIHTGTESLYNFNKITSMIAGAKKYYDPELYDIMTWSTEEMTYYFGIDLSGLDSDVFGGILTCDGGECGYISEKNGDIAYDVVSFVYTDGYTEVKLSASRITQPCDYVYQLKTNDTKDVNGTEVLFGGKYEEFNMGLFFADFEKDGVNYRISSDCISERSFYGIVSKFISL